MQWPNNGATLPKGGQHETCGRCKNSVEVLAENTRDKLPVAVSCAKAESWRYYSPRHECHTGKFSAR